MKIWYSFPLVTAPEAVIFPHLKSNVDTIGAVFMHNNLGITRTRKDTVGLEALEKHLNDSRDKHERPYGLWIKGKADQAHALLERWRAASEQFSDLSLVIRGVSKLDSDILENTQLDSQDSFNEKTMLYLDEKHDPRTFEKLFYSLARNNYAGVVLDVERVSRGHIALAHRFELAALVAGVVHERQEKIALASGADQILIG